MTEVEESYDEDIDAPRALRNIVHHFTTGTITRKRFFKLMASFGYQQAEALKLAENWEDE